MTEHAYPAPMTNPEDPEIVNVDQTDNAALVEFEGEPEPAVYPARLLHAAKDLAGILHEQDVERQDENEPKP